MASVTVREAVIANVKARRFTIVVATFKAVVLEEGHAVALQYEEIQET